MDPHHNTRTGQIFIYVILPFKNYQMEHVTWNFLESSHGKGPADGIGAAVKNFADGKVANGADVLDGNELFDVIKRSSMNVATYLISSSEIDKMKKLVNMLPVIQAIPGSMQIHQLVVTVPRTLIQTVILLLWKFKSETMQLFYTFFSNIRCYLRPSWEYNKEVLRQTNEVRIKYLVYGRWYAGRWCWKFSNRFSHHHTHWERTWSYRQFSKMRNY